MTTLILHPGAPKTATSTLQHILRSNRARLSRAGVGLILPEDIRGKEYLGHYLAAYRGQMIPNMAEITAEFFAPFLQRHDLVICTEETFCHDQMPSRKFGMGGIDRSETAAELLSLSGADNTEVVLTIRPQFDLLTSTYTHFVHRHREARLFDAWMQEEVDPKRLLWTPAVEAFRARFGVEAVRVLSLEIAREQGMEGYLRATLQSFGLGDLDLSMATDKVHNPSPSQRAVHLCRVMNQEIVNPRRSEVVNSFLVDQYPVAEFGKFRPQWQAPAWMVKLWADDHAAALA